MARTGALVIMPVPLFARNCSIAIVMPAFLALNAYVALPELFKE
jgi:hypothetical protein